MRFEQGRIIRDLENKQKCPLCTCLLPVYSRCNCRHVAGGPFACLACNCLLTHPLLCPYHLIICFQCTAITLSLLKGEVVRVIPPLPIPQWLLPSRRLKAFALTLTSQTGQSVLTSPPCPTSGTFLPSALLSSIVFQTQPPPCPFYTGGLPPLSLHLPTTVPLCLQTVSSLASF